MILITGATGLVGSHLTLHLLEQKQMVKALYRDDAGIEKVRTVFEYYQKSDLFDNIIWCKADILDLPALSIAFQDVKEVYHCAALISFDPKDEQKLRKINIEGTANVVNCSIDFNVDKLCYISSIAALGDLKDYETVITEETEWNPEKSHSYYGISKYGAEIEVWRAQQEGIKVIIVNPGVILGPLFWTDGSGDIYKKVQNGLLFYTDGGTGFVSVTDVVRIVFLLMNNEVHNEKYIITAENKSYFDIILTISNVFKTKPPKYKASKWMLNLVCNIDCGLSYLLDKKRYLSKDLVKSIQQTDFYSNEKITKKLQYNFQSIDQYLSTFSNNPVNTN